MKARWPIACAILAASAVAAAIGCLPSDVRPPPDEVKVDVAPSDATANGFTTIDGWTVRFDRVLAGMGDVSLTGDSCSDYASQLLELQEGHGDGYDRLLDVLEGEQKLAWTYGLGSCDVELRVVSPDDQALLGDGVSESDLAFMRTNGSDALETDRPVSLYVVGSATKGSITKKFAWPFRSRGLRFSDCGALGDAGVITSSLDLQGGGTDPLVAVLHAEELFRAEDIDVAPLRFDILAEADQDHDGIVTLDELAFVLVTDLDALDGGAIDGSPAYDASLLTVSDSGVLGEEDGGDASVNFEDETTLEELIYDRLVPRMVEIGGQRCVVNFRTMKQ